MFWPIPADFDKILFAINQNCYNAFSINLVDFNNRNITIYGEIIGFFSLFLLPIWSYFWLFVCLVCAKQILISETILIYLNAKICKFKSPQFFLLLKIDGGGYLGTFFLPPLLETFLCAWCVQLNCMRQKFHENVLWCLKNIRH